MSALISGAHAEVLRALVLGLDLRETVSGWAFVGPWQEHGRSGVSSAAMSVLLSDGLVRRGEGSRAEITPKGKAALQHSTETAIQIALKWRGKIAFESD